MKKILHAVPNEMWFNELLLVETGNNVIPHPHACLDTEEYVLVKTQGKIHTTLGPRRIVIPLVSLATYSESTAIYKSIIIHVTLPIIVGNPREISKWSNSMSILHSLLFETDKRI